MEAILQIASELVSNIQLGGTAIKNMIRNARGLENQSDTRNTKCNQVKHQ
jgi:hypothetical protein